MNWELRCLGFASALLGAQKRPGQVMQGVVGRGSAGFEFTQGRRFLFAFFALC